MSKLALNGGKPVLETSLARYNSIGKEELEAATAVIKSGQLSPFIGAWSNIPNVGGFYGGPKVQQFEEDVKNYFSVKHAITVNSWTSGLIAALGAIGLEPGDEVIVSPWTMCATATAILHWFAIPVFADIEEETFNLDIDSIRKNITPYTKAIIVPEIFGHPADIDKIMDLASGKKIKVISDTAQSPIAKYKNSFAGLKSDIGGFSLNYHKHIQTGEGGILVTKDDDYAVRMQLIRNHGEAVVEKMGYKNINNIVGYNFRMGEIEAAIGIEQLKKLQVLVGRRVEIAKKITKGLTSLSGLKLPTTKKDCSHSYYIYGIQFNPKEMGCTRDQVCNALKAEGIPISNEYANLHLLPMFQKKIAYGNNNLPWSGEFYKGNVSYEKGICPVAEKINDKTFIKIPICDYQWSNEDVDKLIEAFKKVWLNIDQIN